MDITGKTAFTGLIGSPVAHSISPQMHNEAFRQLGIDCVYLAFDISPEELETAVMGLKAAGILGFNVTMPHKTTVTALCDELTPASQIAGASNTIIHRDGKLIGHTTDGVGFMESVRDAGYNIIQKTMTLLGCGGAATAICTQAALDGVRTIHIFEQPVSPFQEHAQAFADRVNRMTDCTVTVNDITDKDLLKKRIAESDMLTNATNVGMAPDTDACLIPDATFLRPELLVCDIIYNPRETKLYRMAEKAGCRVMNGLYLLLFQGAASFECWTGRKMPVEIIRKKYFTE